MITLRRLVPHMVGERELGKQISTFQLNEEKLKDYIGGAMKHNGIPKGLFATYQEIVLQEWDNSMSEYASIIDFTSPDYREAALKYNEKLALIRKGMESTTRGRNTLKRMAKKGHDDGTTIPYPSFNEKELV